MEKRLMRTLVILLCGIAMALVAYAGQKGGPESDSLEHLGRHRGESIHLSEKNGFLLDYRLLPADPSSPSKAPELVLYISGEGEGLVDEAAVVYSITGPRGSKLQARALPLLGSYEADIYFSVPGRYLVATEIRTSRGTLNDRFDYEFL